MNKLRLYVKGFLIGMIAEYGFRVEFGYLQATILTALILEMLIKVIADWKDEDL
jgi:hypothetical protein